MTSGSLIRSTLFTALFSGVLAIAGCNGDAGSSATATGEVTISHQAQATKTVSQKTAASTDAAIPDGVDSLQIKFEDASGNVVYGPVEVPAAPQVSIQNVPLIATSLTVDYLRNGGYALATDDEPIAWSNGLGSARPTPAAAKPSVTQWKTAMDANGIARLSVAVNGGPFSDLLLKGVAYSPAPIGFSNKDGPSFGDIFWDTPGGFLDFSAVWKRDMETIRSHGFNAVRTYSFIANFIKNNGTIPTQAEINKPGSLLVRQHKKFLDEAWNNGVNPIYVLVGIPMPPAIYLKQDYDDTHNADAIKFWDNNFTATVEQMKDHPAVIGFTIFNEVGGTPDYSGDTTKATHYWRQIQIYSARAKERAPNKLVGWAFNDDPVFATSTVEYRKTYAAAVDFYGVNAFQPEQLKTALDPWQQSIQGTASRPIWLTEYGLPATSRTVAGRPESIYSDAATHAKVAKAVGTVIPMAFRHPVVTGMFYFEWSDEWWKQEGDAMRKDRQEGGNANKGGFPNGYADEEGFGLNSIALGKRAANQVYTDHPDGIGGNLQVDVLTPRTELMDTVTGAFRNAAQTRKDALGVDVK